MRQTESVPLTPEQHERQHLGLKTQRDGDTTTVTLYARMLNGTNAPALLSRIATELAAGVTDVRLDLSRCDRGLDEKGRDAVRAIVDSVREHGGTFEVER